MNHIWLCDLGHLLSSALQKWMASSLVFWIVEKTLEIVSFIFALVCTAYGPEVCSSANNSIQDLDLSGSYKCFLETVSLECSNSLKGIKISLFKQFHSLPQCYFFLQRNIVNLVIIWWVTIQNYMGTALPRHLPPSQLSESSPILIAPSLSEPHENHFHKYQYKLSSCHPVSTHCGDSLMTPCPWSWIYFWNEVLLHIVPCMLNMCAMMYCYLYHEIFVCTWNAGIILPLLNGDQPLFKMI